MYTYIICVPKNDDLFKEGGHKHCVNNAYLIRKRFITMILQLLVFYYCSQKTA